MEADTMGPREQTIADQIEAAGLPRPSMVTIAASGQSIAVAFCRGTYTDTVEGYGSSDEAAAADVIRQVRLAGGGGA